MNWDILKCLKTQNFPRNLHVTNVDVKPNKKQQIIRLILLELLLLNNWKVRPCGGGMCVRHMMPDNLTNWTFIAYV